MQTDFQTLSDEYDSLRNKHEIISRQRCELANKVQTLRLSRADAALAGNTFDDGGEVARLTADCEVLDDALGVLNQHLEDLAPKVTAAREEYRIASVESRLREKMAEHLAHVEHAERAFGPCGACRESRRSAGDRAWQYRPD